MLIEKAFGKVSGDTLCSVTIPQFGNASILSVHRESCISIPTNCLGVTANHRVGALFDGDRTFGVFT